MAARQPRRRRAAQPALLDGAGLPGADRVARLGPPAPGARTAAAARRMAAPGGQRAGAGLPDAVGLPAARRRRRPAGTTHSGGNAEPAAAGRAAAGAVSAGQRQRLAAGRLSAACRHRHRHRLAGGGGACAAPVGWPARLGVDHGGLWRAGAAGVCRPARRAACGGEGPLVLPRPAGTAALVVLAGLAAVGGRGPAAAAGLAARGAASGHGARQRRALCGRGAVSAALHGRAVRPWCLLEPGAGLARRPGRPACRPGAGTGDGGDGEGGAAPGDGPARRLPVVPRRHDRLQPGAQTRSGGLRFLPRGRPLHARRRACPPRHGAGAGQHRRRRAQLRPGRLPCRHRAAGGAFDHDHLCRCHRHQPPRLRRRPAGRRGTGPAAACAPAGPQRRRQPSAPAVRGLPPGPRQDHLGPHRPGIARRRLQRLPPEVQPRGPGGAEGLCAGHPRTHRWRRAGAAITFWQALSARAPTPVGARQRTALLWLPQPQQPHLHQLRRLARDAPRPRRGRAQDPGQPLSAAAGRPLLRAQERRSAPQRGAGVHRLPHGAGGDGQRPHRGQQGTGAARALRGLPRRCRRQAGLARRQGHRP